MIGTVVAPDPNWLLRHPYLQNSASQTLGKDYAPKRELNSQVLVLVARDQVKSGSACHPLGALTLTTAKKREFIS